MKDENNLRWSMDDVAHQYKIENPNWTWKECWVKARLVHKELKKLNKETWDNNKQFFKMNTPFSFYHDKDDEFGGIHELRNGE